MINESPKEFTNKGLEQAPQAIRRAEILRQKGEIDEALRTLTPFLADNFDCVPALILAANIMLDADKIGMAHPLLMRAAQLEPDNAMVWNDIGICYREGSNWQEAETHFWRGLKIAPHDANLNTNLASLYVNMGQPQIALRHLKTAIAADASIPEAYYQRARANIALGNYKDGWADFDAVLGQGETRGERIYGMVPRWNGVDGKKIIAFGEQGIGDEIAFASCIPDLAAKNDVIIECAPKLWGLFKRSFRLETHGTRFDLRLPWLHNQQTGALRKMDAGVAFGSLPQYYRNSLESFPGKPYLVADPERRLQWRTLLDSLGSKLKVGISWTGGNQNTGKARRSVDLYDMLPILNQDATFISLQYKDAPEIYALEHDCGIKIHHWKHATQTDDYDDTAALVAELDLVISVTTAVIHLAGALGTPCWVLTPKMPRYFYGITGDDMPWYSSVKLYRQKGQWVEAIAQAGSDLRKRINTPRAA